MQIKLLVYGIAKTFGLFALCRVLTRFRIRILGYHGASLGDELDYNPCLYVSAGTFRRRIHWLQKKGFTVIPLELAANALDGGVDAGRLPTVITFDDGWHSTATELVPILAEQGLPSTLYLSTDDFLRGWPILAVVVNYMIWKSALRQVEIRNLGEPIDGDHRLDEPRARNLFVRRSHRWLTAQPATRSSVIERIHRLVESMGLRVSDMALETRRFDYLSNDELRELARCGCAVEMHGHEHRYPKGDPEVFAEDLAACCDAIVQFGLPKPRHYCYPSGNFDDAAATVLERFGVHSATTCIPGLISRANGNAQRHALPRFLDGEHIDMLVFEAEMSGFADLLRHAMGR